MTLSFYVLILGNIIIIFANNTALREFSKSNVKFTADLYRKLSANSTQNIIFSPTSLQICLALTLEGAKNTTASELSTALNLPFRSTTRKAIRSLKLNLSTDKVTLMSANKFYIGKGYTILDSFLNLAENTYQSDVATIDFSNSYTAANVINQWVSDTTNGTIQNLINPDQLDSLTKFVLLNALYFNGQWDVPFDSKNTHLDKFYTDSTSVDVHMMNSVNDYLFYNCEELKAKFLEITYKDTDIGMTFVLPHERDGLAKIEGDINLYLERQNLSTEKVNVSIPVFNSTNHIDFKDVLKKLGIRQLFKDTANLTGMSSRTGLYVKHVIQKAFVGISEVGTKAAAATAVIGKARNLAGVIPLQENVVFKADHPFLFYIRDNNSDVILFVGRFVK